jgi:hypothetical protein
LTQVANEVQKYKRRAQTMEGPYILAPHRADPRYIYKYIYIIYRYTYKMVSV